MKSKFHEFLYLYSLTNSKSVIKKILLLIAFLAIISCAKEKPVDYILFSGNISNAAMDQLTINIERGNDIVIDLVDGKFKDTLYLKSGIYALSDGVNKVDLYVDNGFNLKISYDHSDFNETLLFEGNGSLENAYIVKRNERKKAIWGIRNDLIKLEEFEFREKLREFENAMEKMIAENNEISPEFEAKERRNIAHAVRYQMTAYDNIHGQLTNKENFEVGEDFYDGLAPIDYENEEDFLFSQDYNFLVTIKYYEAGRALSKEEGINEYTAALISIRRNSNETIRNMVSFAMAQRGVVYADDPVAYYNLFKEISTNLKHEEIVGKNYERVLKLVKGAPSPKFENYENYDGGNTSLDDLKGKYVYIDVWATWCKPCIAEIPSLKEVEKKYHNKNIEFVSISVDSQKDYETWRTMIEEKELGGVQLFGERNRVQEFRDEYMISGIPRFILIDPNGNIVAHMAPRPSNKKLIELFEELEI